MLFVLKTIKAGLALGYVLVPEGKGIATAGLTQFTQSQSTLDA